MKLSRGITSFLLSVTMLSSLIGTPASLNADTDPEKAIINESLLPEVLDYDIAIAKEYTDRLYDEEPDLNTAAFINRNNIRTLCIFGRDIKYIDDSGIVRDKSNRLARVANGYTNPKNNISVFYPDNIANGISVSYDDYEVGLLPPATGNGTASSALLIASGQRTVSDSVMYTDTFGQNSSAQFCQIFDGVTAKITAYDSNANVIATFRLQTGGLLPGISPDGCLTLTDEKNDGIIGSLSAPVCTRNGISRPAVYRMAPSSGSDEIIVEIVDAPSATASGDSTGNFPTTVIFSYTISAASALNFEDTTIYENYTAASEGSTPNLYVGNCRALLGSSAGQKQKARTLVRFPTLMLNSTVAGYFDEGCILSVNYNFRTSFSDGYAEPRTILAYIATSRWRENTSVYSESLWNAKGSYVGKATVTQADHIGAPFDTYSIDISLAYKKWKNRSASDYGIMLVADDEANQSVPAVMLGAKENPDSGTSDVKPFVSVDYTRLYSGIIYRLKNVGTGNYMTVENGHPYKKMSVKDAPKNSNTPLFSQEFVFEFLDGQNAYRIRPICSVFGKYCTLDIIRGGKALASGQKLQTYTAVDPTAQTFAVNSLGDRNTIEIVTKSNTSLAVSAAATGTQLELSTKSDGNSKQQWILERSELTDEYYYYSKMGMSFPINSATPKITSDFGPRSVSVGSSNHGGIDIGASSGTPLISMFEGRVIHFGNDSGRGNNIIVEATKDYYNAYDSQIRLRFVYMHMSEAANITDSSIYIGGTVARDRQIGKVGNSGTSGGAHLHLAVNINGSTSFNPSDCISPVMLFPDIGFIIGIEN